MQTDLSLQVKTWGFKFLLALALQVFLYAGAFAQAPYISSFSPAEGNVGSLVTLTGSNFTGTTKVFFGGLSTTSFTVVNNTTITVTVPNDAQTGSIAVLNASGLNISQRNFWVNNPQNAAFAGSNRGIIKDNGKIYGWADANRDLGDGSARANKYCPLEIPLKGSLINKTISQICIGNNHVLILASDHTLHAFGVNNNGQLGNNSTTTSALPIEITNSGSLNGKVITQIGIGIYYSVALCSDGTVHTWGDGSFGQLGNGTTSGNVLVPTNISNSGSITGKTIIKISSTTASTLLLASDSTLHGFGRNNSGCLGLGHSNNQSTPAAVVMSGVLAGKCITTLTAGYFVGLLIDNTGVVYGMGGAYAIANTLASNVPIVIQAGASSSLNGKKIVAVAGNQNSENGYALDVNGAAHAWGTNSFGQLGNNSTSITNIPILVNTSTTLNGKTISSIASGNDRLLIKTTDNTYHTFGSATFGALADGQSSTNGLVSKEITLPSKPATEAGNLNVSSITGSTATLTWSNGSGQKRLVVVKPVTAVGSNAVFDGLSYTANTVFGSGATIDGTGKVVYSGTNNTTNVSGLTPGTTYWVAVFEYDTAVSPCNFNYYKLGSPLSGSFATPAPASSPVVVTASAGSVTANSAVLGGNISDSGNAVIIQRGVVYASTANPDTSKTKVQMGTGSGAFSQTVGGLLSGTTYHVRAYAINSVGLSYGADSSFTTAATVPSVETVGSVGITSTTADLLGEVKSSGGATVSARGFVYATTANPDTSKSKVQLAGGVGQFSSGISGLSVATTYHYRAYAINSQGISYGADSMFTTAATVPVVISATATSVSNNAAVLGGNITFDGGMAITQRGVVYAITANPDTNNTKVIMGSGAGAFSQPVNGLNGSTTYHYRAYAINGKGIAYGADSSFTTTAGPTLATVITSSVSGISSSAATMGGDVISNGGATVTERGIVYDINVNPDLNKTKVTMGNGNGTFSQLVTGLNAATTYHVRAYAVNIAGVSYGADSTFTTAAGPSLATVITGSATQITAKGAMLAGNVTADGNATVSERGIVFSVNIKPTVADAKVGMGTGTGSFSGNVSGLNPSTKYYYRAYAINAAGTAYGADSIFTTPAEAVSTVYNTFTPNGDGFNDFWNPGNPTDLKGHEIVVYNYFGQEVFRQTGYDTPWDGKKDGNLLPSGEYYYIISGDTINTKGALLIKGN